MSDGTQDRGPKPPRTLFSLGRPGAGPAPAAPGADEPDADLEATDDAVADEELQYDLL